MANNANIRARKGAADTQSNSANSNNTARMASNDTARTVTNGWRGLGAYQLMTYSRCRVFRYNNQNPQTAT